MFNRRRTDEDNIGSSIFMALIEELRRRTSGTETPTVGVKPTPVVVVRASLGSEFQSDSPHDEMDH
jgi:hypothetical protein